MDNNNQQGPPVANTIETENDQRQTMEVATEFNTGGVNPQDNQMINREDGGFDPTAAQQQQQQMNQGAGNPVDGRATPQTNQGLDMLANLDNVGNIVMRLPSHIMSLGTSGFTNAWATITHSIFGITQAMNIPTPSNIAFQLQSQFLLPPTDLVEAEMGSDKFSVDYFSSDEAKNLRLKISLRQITDIADAGSKSKNLLKRRIADLEKAEIRVKNKLKGDKRTKAMSLIRKRLKRLRAEDEEIHASHHYVSVVGWQQKIFSPREIAKFSQLLHLDEPNLDTHLESVYFDQIKDLVDNVREPEAFHSETFEPYIQESQKRHLIHDLKQPEEAIKRNTLRKKGEQTLTRKKEDKENDDEVEGEGQEDDSMDEDDYDKLESAEAMQRAKEREERKFGANGARDLLRHKIFTYTTHDQFFSSDLLEPIPCSSKTYPRSLLKKRKHHDPNAPKYMYIMSSMGDRVDKIADDQYEWHGNEYLLAILILYPDGSFKLRPGLSSLPKDQPQKSYRKHKKHKKKELTNERVYMFKTADGIIFEYTLHLYNEAKRDMKVERLRNSILREMSSRSLGMRRNLVGSRFTHVPEGMKECHVQLNLVKIANVFESSYTADPVRVRYFWDFSKCGLEAGKELNLLDNAGTQITACSQFAHPTFENNEHYFSFPIQLSARIPNDVHHVPVYLYFDVLARGRNDSYYPTGYGFTTINLAQPQSLTNEKVPTWNVKQSIRHEMLSYFIGGAEELDDMSYVGIPHTFNDVFMNKYGFETEPAGVMTLSRSNIVAPSVSKEVLRHRKEWIKQQRDRYRSNQLGGLHSMDKDTFNIDDILKGRKFRKFIVNKDRQFASSPQTTSKRRNRSPFRGRSPSRR